MMMGSQNLARRWRTFRTRRARRVAAICHHCHAVPPTSNAPEEVRLRRTARKKEGRSCLAHKLVGLPNLRHIHIELRRCGQSLKFVRKPFQIFSGQNVELWTFEIIADMALRKKAT